MDSTAFLLATLTVTLAGVAVQAWRIVNERRDVALLAVMVVVLGAGTVAAAVR